MGQFSVKTSAPPGSILSATQQPDLSIELLNRQMSGEEVKVIDVTVEGDGFGYVFG